uniref:Fe2OG dioxygenase domain-containing protein n=1 Tax=Oryza brachyantha TaxID=4533 RepID=J3MD02_ORYBR
MMASHYYPVCPEPERTMGIVPHTDPGVLTILAQDDIGGLQVKHTDEDGASYWVDAKPLPGALVINVGDLLQIMSNDKYKSVEHRVVMNLREEPRVSSAIFYNPGRRGDSVFYGPLPELISSENPPKLAAGVSTKEIMSSSCYSGGDGDVNGGDELTPLRKH